MLRNPSIWKGPAGRQPVLLLAGLALVCPLARAAGQSNSPEKTAGKLITPETDRAIERGLMFLASRQHPDGSFGSGGYRTNVAVVSLCAMALMSAGSTPGRGPYGAEVNRALDYVLANTQEGGFIFAPAQSQYGPQHGPMYGHGFAAMFLAECYGMAPQPELRKKLGEAVRLIINCQNHEGGWRYEPQRVEAADISVTVCQVMALRAARNAGIAVPRETIDRAAEYIKRSQNPDGGFMYMLSVGGESAFPRSAAAVVGLYSAGIYEGPELTRGLDYLMGFLPRRGVQRRETWYYYGHYYAALAMWQAGAAYWDRWYPAVRDELLARQRPDGSWVDLSVSNEFATAMACMVLQMPNNCLPIFVR
ncbi:MAG: prenyltransferase/squalene oxidase repeat-containing protein [Thermoguttaceae bacterium]